MHAEIQTSPEPGCPLWGAKMVLRLPMPEQSWKPFWIFSRHPECQGMFQVGSNGKPKGDEDWLDEGM